MDIIPGIPEAAHDEEASKSFDSEASDTESENDSEDLTETVKRLRVRAPN